MTLPITFHRAARKEFDEAIDWYESQRVGLGDEFEEQVQAVLDRIAALPELHQCVLNDIRRTVVRRFPYLVYYRVKGNCIRVISVFHARRNPTIWQRRT
jgi:plasmid stabilization system protein ParE